MKTTDPLRSYKETQIKTATPGKLVVMLYDGALKHLALAQEALQSRHRRYDLVSGELVRVQDIVTELMVSLDFERGGEIARNLFGLYMWMNRQVLDCNIRKDAAPLQPVRKLLMELRAAWAEVAEKHGTESPTRSGGGVNIAG